MLKVKGQSKRKRQGKEVAAKAEEKDSNNDGVWMATIDFEEEEVQESCKMWTAEEIIADGDIWEECLSNIITFDADEALTMSNDPDDSLKDNEMAVNVEIDELIGENGCESLEDDSTIDDGENTTTYTFVAITLAGPNSTVEMEVYDSGASHHMLPYCHKFIKFETIQKRLLTTANGGHFEAVGKGEMHIMMPNGRTKTQILLKDVLYAPKMGVTLVSIGKIDTAGHTVLFHKNQL